MFRQCKNWFGIFLLIYSTFCSDEIINLAKPTKVIFDVTNLEKDQGFYSLNIGNNSNYIHSDLEYISFEYENPISHQNPEFWSMDGYFNITGIGFLFKPHPDAQETIYRLKTSSLSLIKTAVHKLDSMLDAIFFQVDPFYSNFQLCQCHKFSAGLENLFQEKLQLKNISDQSNLKIGIKYDEGLIACCNASTFRFLEKVDIAIFVLPVDPVKLLLSADLFLDHVRHAISINRKFVHSVNSYVKLYVNLVVKRIVGFKDQDDLHFKYLALLKLYIDVWLQTESTGEFIIMESFLQSFQPAKYKLGNVLPMLMDWKPRHYWEDFKSTCQLHYLLNTISNSFGDFILKDFSTTSFKAMQDDCQQYSTTPIFRKNVIKNISVILDEDNWNDALQEINLQRSQEGGLRIDTVYLKGYQYASISEIDDLLASGIRVGCYVTDAKVSSALSDCGEIFNKSSTFLFETFLLEREIDELMPEELYNLYKERKNFSTTYPNNEFIPLVIVTNDNSNPFWPRSMIRNTVRQTLYCDSTLQKLYKYYDSILTFFEIHQFKKVGLNSAVHRGHVDGWWNTIETVKTINRTATNFPLLVQRNLPPNLKATLNLSNQFDCIEWSSSPNEQTNGINFKEQIFFGGFIDQYALRNTSLSAKETQILLLFAFSKFSFVEIITNDEHQISSILSALTSELVETIFSFYVYRDLVYLVEIPYDKLVSSYPFIENAQSIVQNSLGVHISRWENASEIDYITVLELLKENFKKEYSKLTSAKFGLTITNCLDQVNSQFLRMRLTKFIKYTSFVVCNMPPLKADNSNQDRMQMFLDTNFYVQMYFKNFPSLQDIPIYFRYTFLAEKCEGTSTETANFLRILNDLNEHSKKYGVKYIINLFEPEHTPDCPFAWWKISNTKDLRNESVFTEREASYFGRETKLNLKLKNIPDTYDISPSSITLIIVTVSSLAILLTLVSISVVIWYKFKTRRQWFLSSEEMEIFRQGNVFEEAAEANDLLKVLKYDFQFEIERDNIQLQKCVGKGRFGQVFKGLLLSENLQVAVKLPITECIKESFLSMLTEVKILCYAGSHPFVIAFIGASTQEIRKGKLYIVTEYCENGSLQSYLWSKKSPHSDDSALFVNMYQLCLFSYQIATGMVYISGKNIVHGDLSTRNILVNADLICKIGDFGLSRRLYENDEYVKKNKEPLPWRWLALESLKNRVFTTASDVWSYGITVWEIFTFGELPYPSKEFTDEFIHEVENGLRLSIAKYSSEVIHESLLKCWDANPQARPSFQQLSDFFAAVIRAEYDM